MTPPGDNEASGSPVPTVPKRVTVAHTPSPAFEQSGVHKAALAVCRTLQRAGHEAVYVGGAVRDSLLWPNATPHDIDIATSATPHSVAALFPGSGFVGKSFGVSLVRADGHAFEVATFRKEGAYSDRRHPDSVGHGNRQDDSKRRDFTINALFFDPVSQEIDDFHGGLADLHTRTLRCVGIARERLFEDPLRILRLFRFAVATGFEIEANTLAAAQESAVAEGMRLLSRERILAEIVKVRPGLAPPFFARFFNAFAPNLLDASFPFTVSHGGGLSADEAGGMRLRVLEKHSFWARHPLIHKRFPATTLGVFLRAVADAPSPETSLFEALEAWPLQASDRELLRVLFSLSAGLDGLEGLDFAPRAFRFHRMLRSLREVTPQEFVGFVSLPDAVASASASECMTHAEGIFHAEAARSEQPLSEFLRWLPSAPVPWLPPRVTLNAFREDQGLPQETLGTLHALWDAFALQGDAVPVAFRSNHEWKLSWRKALEACSKGGKVHFRGLRFGGS